jgi:vacuole morphology and inheritance protein 14
MSPEIIYQDFNLKEFIWIVKIKIKSQNPSIREFLIRWITNLNEVITVDLLSYLPEILEDLLFMLGDKEKNLRKSTEECLGNF